MHIALFGFVIFSTAGCTSKSIEQDHDQKNRSECMRLNPPSNCLSLLYNQLQKAKKSKETKITNQGCLGGSPPSDCLLPLSASFRAARMVKNHEVANATKTKKCNITNSIHTFKLVSSVEYCKRFPEECEKSGDKYKKSIFYKPGVDNGDNNPEEWFLENPDYLFAKDLQYNYSSGNLKIINGEKKYEHCVFY
jgi:hypothetical protein